MIRAALLAIQFLTRFPITLKRAPEARELGLSVLFYPLIGLAIGGLLYTLHSLLPPTTPLLNAALLLSCWTAISGALHLDGLADCADAWIGAHGDRQRALHILRDPASGPVAVATVSCLLLTKFAALASLNDAIALIAAPLAGRTLLLAALRLAPLARPDGLAASLATHLPANPALWASGGATLLLLWLAGPWALSAAILTGLGVVHAARQRLGGINGDVAGALCELGETVVLITLVLAAA